jgi:two-component system OmpR family response regulator
MSYILIVDDDVDSREAVARYVRRAGHRVACAGNGREAMKALIDQTPDLVILDARMPEMDGVSFLEVIRCYLRWQHLPVILLTAYSEGLHIRRAVELGVRKTLLKANFEMDELLAHIEACAGSAESMDTNELPPPQGLMN